MEQPVRQRNTYKPRSQPIHSTKTIPENIPKITDNDEYGYLAIGDIPPPLPPRNKNPKYQCCNSDVCECY